MMSFLKKPYRSSTRVLLGMMISTWLSLSHSATASQCGTFEIIQGPDSGTADGTISHLAALNDGTAWAISSLNGETVLLYFNGSAWVAQTLPEGIEGIAFADSTATPDGDVWLTGTRAYSVYEVEVIFLRARNGSIDRIDHFFSPRAPVDISGSSASDVWALTGAGDVIHFDGSDWTQMDVPSPYQRLYPRGIYAVGPNDVWAVGYGGDGRAEYIGYTQHWDGSSWTTVWTPFDGLDNHFFRGVDGSATDDVWVVGYINYSQTIALHWDGSSWTQFSGPPSGAPFLDVSALTSDDAYATPYSQNDFNTLFYWNGEGWREIIPLNPPEGVAVLWRDLAKAGSCDLWITGSYLIESSYNTLVARLQPRAVKGDLNGDDNVTIEDAVEALNTITSKSTGTINLRADVNNDGVIGIAEVIYILGEVAGTP